MSHRPALVLACVAALAACTNDFDQFEPDGFAVASGAGAAGVGTSTSVGVTSVGPGGAASSATTGATTTSATVGSGGGSSSSTAASSAASTAASSAASTAASSAASTAASSGAGGMGGAGPVLSCANMPCAAGEICCHNGMSPNGDNCGASGSCGGDAEISCSGPGSCPGNEVCCGTLGGANVYVEVSCQATCSAGQVLMCTGEPSVCMGGQTCNDSMTLGMGYQYCG